MVGRKVSSAHAIVGVRRSVGFLKIILDFHPKVLYKRLSDGRTGNSAGLINWL